jgi:pyridoxal phosphate enzyme (YggS family)
MAVLLFLYKTKIMAVNKIAYQNIITQINNKATLVAVSKTKPVQDIKELYDLGQRDFGENYVQELIEKQPQLPADIHWHFIGHLQTNKVKYIAPFVHLIHGVDSLKLLKEINKQAQKSNRNINCLLQVHIAQEETKFGFSKHEIQELTTTHLQEFKHVTIKGVMGMASFTNNEIQVRNEFKELVKASLLLKQIIPAATIISMGMSGDYLWAIEEGSTMVRIGSLLFGARNTQQ